MFIISFSITVHHLCTGHGLSGVLVAVDVSAPSVDLGRKHGLGLAQDPLLSLIFTFVKIVILPVDTEVHEFFVNLIDLMVCQRKGLAVNQSFEDRQLVDHQGVLLLSCLLYRTQVVFQNLIIKGVRVPLLGPQVHDGAAHFK